MPLLPFAEQAEHRLAAVSRDVLADLDHDHRVFLAGVEAARAERRREDVAEEVDAELHRRANAVVQALASALPHVDAVAARRRRQKAAGARARENGYPWPQEAS
jgi:hypothetical protein